MQKARVSEALQMAEQAEKAVKEEEKRLATSRYDEIKINQQ
jgi:hypothetical protein